MISYDRFYQMLYRIFTREPKLDAIPLETILDSIKTVDRIDGMTHGVVLVRTDLDTPIKDGKVADLSRLEAAAPTIKYYLERDCKVVIFGHLGREKHLSLRPVCEAMSELVGQNIEFIPEWVDEAQMKLLDLVVSKVASAAPGSAFMLENTRKYDMETILWKATAEEFPVISNNLYSLASDFQKRLASIVINEAIAASNFDFSSSVLPLVMSRTGMGFYISEEMNKHIKEARKANMVVMSGLKINKLDDLEAILERRSVKWIITAGSLAMGLKKAHALLSGGDFRIGRAETNETEKSFISAKRIEQCKRIVQQCTEQGIKLILPRDFILDNGEVSEEIPPERVQLDIGPKTREYYAAQISDYIEMSKKATEPYVMFYNGVFGKFEDPSYEGGTREFISQLKELTKAGVATYVGGGEGRLALVKFGDLSDVTHAFTAGGTILKSLSNRHIAFLKAMYLQNKQGVN